MHEMREREREYNFSILPFDILIDIMLDQQLVLLSNISLSFILLLLFLSYLSTLSCVSFSLFCFFISVFYPLLPILLYETHTFYTYLLPPFSLSSRYQLATYLRKKKRKFKLQTRSKPVPQL